MATITAFQAPLSLHQYCRLQEPTIELPHPRELFEYIAETLAEKGLMTYAQADPFRKRIPSHGLFLLVPAPDPGIFDDKEMHTWLDYYCSMIEVLGRRGQNKLRRFDVANIVRGDGPYLLTGIDDGWRKTPPSANPYNVWQGIIHAIVFPHVFADHDLILADSPCGSAVAVLEMKNGRDEGPPQLGVMSGHWHPDHGIPTYEEKVFA